MFKSIPSSLFPLSLFWTVVGAALFLSISYEMKITNSGGGFTDNEERQPLEGHLYDSEIFVLNHKKKNVRESGNTKKNRERLHLNSAHIIDGGAEGNRWFDHPIGDVLTLDGQKVFFSSREGRYLQEKSILDLIGDAHVWDKESDLKGKQVKYFLAKDYFEVFDDVRSRHISEESTDEIFINSNYAISWPNFNKAVYKGEVSGRYDKKRPLSPSVFLWGDKLTALLNKNLITLEGNAKLKRVNVIAKGKWAEVFLDEKNKNLRDYAVYENVRLKETFKDQVTGRSIFRKATSEKLEGLPLKGQIILTGLPKVWQGGDIIRGHIITLFESKEFIEVEETSSSFHIKE